MRIIHIVGTLDKSAGGPSRSVPQTCENVAKLGVNIELVARPSRNPVKLNSTSTYKVSFKSIPELILFGLKLSKKKISLIHLQHVWTPYIHIMARIARLKSIPYIITPRGMLEPWIMARHPLKKQIAMFLYQRKDIRKAAAIHATCEMEKENIRKLGFTNPITVIPNGIDLSEVPSGKKKYGTKKIVFLSRIHIKKGLELLIDAWSQINTKGWSLEIAGEGEQNYIENLKSIIKSKGIRNISFVGPQYGNAKWNFIQSGDIFILPTFSENFGIVIPEALACGVPVITTKGTPWSELKSNNCGWWIDLTTENLIQSISDAMKKSSDELQRMGVNGRKLVKKGYDVKAVAGKMKQFYNKISN